MRITRSQLRQPIREESAKDSLRAVGDQGESLIREASIEIPPAVKKKGVEVGMALLLSMTSTSAGREKLASLLVAIPDFIKQYLCGLPSDWLQTSGGEKRSMLGSAWGMICKFGVTIIPVFAPLYALAWFLRLLSDDDAKAIASQASPPSTEEDVEVETEDAEGVITGPEEEIPPQAQWSPRAEPAIAESFSRSRMLLLSGISPREE